MQKKYLPFDHIISPVSANQAFTLIFFQVKIFSRAKALLLATNTFSFNGKRKDLLFEA